VRASSSFFVILSLFMVLSCVAVLSCGGTSSAPGADGGAGAGGSQTMAGPHGCTNIQVSCTSPTGASCEEWAGFDAKSLANFKAMCNHPNQVWSDGPCDRTGTVGGCEQPVNGVCDVIWSFAPVTAADLQMGCVGPNRMLVTP
jgi:hypothetical protein